MNNEQEVQEKYMMLQMLAATLKQVQQQVELAEQQSEEVDRITSGLDDLAKASPGTSMLVPLSEGVFVRAKLEDASHLLVNVGSGIVVDKTIAQAKELLVARKTELTAHHEGMQKQLHEMMGEAQRLQEELNKLITE